MQLSNSKPDRRSLQCALLGIGLSLVAAGVTADETAPAAAPDGPVALGTLEVLITGFESEQGRLAIALFANADDYATQENAVRRAWLDIANGRSRWLVEQLPEGEYALIAYHDENGNEQIDMRVLGMPKEPVGVSNNARGLFGPPRFKSARFEFRSPLTRHEIELQ